MTALTWPFEGGRRNVDSFYNLRMSEQPDADELLKRYTDMMGKPLGPFFHHLWQDLATLHLKWNEYRPLFGTNEACFATMNRAAPGFFALVYDMWWHEILLTLWKLTDDDDRTLSIRRLPPMVPLPLRTQLEPKIGDAVAACKFTQKGRHNLLAHRNADIAMKLKPTPESSREDVRKAIEALDTVFDLVHGAYTGEEPMMWDHLNARGGSEYLLWIVRRGLAARDEDIAQFRPAMKFDD
jgi:HEPN superfamily AbiU2-like protein